MEHWYAFPCSVRSIENGEPKQVPGLDPGEIAFGWTGDGEGVYAYRPSVPAHIYQMISPLGAARYGMISTLSILRASTSSAPLMSRPTAYAYNYNRVLSSLYLVDGLE